MKKSSIIAMILTIVVVSPCIVGYAVPTGEHIDQSFEADEFINITDAVSSDSIQMYVEYNGPNNNLYSNSINLNLPWSSFEPVKTSTTKSPYPVISEKNDSKKITVSNGFVPTNEPGNYSTTYEVKSPWVFRSGPSGPNDEYFWGEMVRVYENGKIDFLENKGILGTDTRLPVGLDAEDVKLESEFTTEQTTKCTVTGQEISSYADQSSGWVVPDIDKTTRTAWVNGHANTKLDIIFKMVPSTDNAHINLYWSDQPGCQFNIFMKGSDWYIGDQNIGSSYAYEYLLVSLDAPNKKVLVSGLIGLQDFGDKSYNFKKGNSFEYTVNFMGDWFDFINIRGESVADNAASFAVVSSEIDSGFAYGISNQLIEVNGWTPDNYLMTLSQTAVYGKYITIGENSYPVVNGSISVNGIKLPVSGLEIMGIKTGSDAGIYLNTEKVTDVYSDRIKLGGDWMTQVLVSDVYSVDIKHFDWTPGGFGLDMQGFCSVGLLASLAAFIVVGLIGRRDGGSMAVALITSAVSGIVYLILLM